MTTADGRPVAGLTVAIVDLSLTTTTDAVGNYAFDAVRPGIRATVAVVRNQRVLASSFTLISLSVERIDFRLPVAADTPQSSARARRGEGQATIRQARDGTLTEQTPEPAVTAPFPVMSRMGAAETTVVTSHDAASLPALEPGDVFKVLQLLPGVAATEAAAGLSIEGGTPDETVVNYGGFRIFGTEQLEGHFSAFNPGTTDAVTMHRGVYAARFGGGLAGVAEVEDRPHADRVLGSLSASLLSAGGTLETPLGDAASVLVGYRRSALGQFDAAFLGTSGGSATPAGTPADGQWFGTATTTLPRGVAEVMNARLDLTPSGRDRLTVTAYRGIDGLDVAHTLMLPTGLDTLLTDAGLTTTDGVTGAESRDDRQTGLGIRWNHEWSPHVRITATFGRSDFDSSRTRATNAIGRQSADADMNVVDDTTLRLDVPITFSPANTLDVGMELATFRASYQHESVFDALATDDGSFSSALDRAGTGRVTSFYAGHRATFGGRVTAEPGVRYSRFTSTSGWVAEPRLSASVALTSRFKIIGGWGRTHQFIGQVADEDLLQGTRAFWVVADGIDIPVAVSDNASVRGVYESPALLVDAEYFDRRVSNQSLLAPPLTGATTGIDLARFFYVGRARARGIAVLAQRKVGRVSGLVSYTHSQVTDDIPGLGTFRGDTDAPHELKFVDGVTIRGWTLASTWVFASGRPYTAPTSVVPVSSGLLGGTVEQIVFGPRNGAQLPQYHRLDLSARREWPLVDDRTATFGLTAYNAYNRANVWRKEFTNVGGQMLENDIALMGFTLNAFFSIAF